MTDSRFKAPSHIPILKKSVQYESFCEIDAVLDSHTTMETAIYLLERGYREYTY